SVLVAWLGWFSMVGGVAFAGLAAPALALASPASDTYLVDDAAPSQRDVVLSAAGVQLPMPVHAPRVRSGWAGQAAWLRLLAGSQDAMCSVRLALAADGGGTSRRPQGSTRFARHWPRSDCDDPASARS
ncbi:MAG: hypothetical protein ABW321_19670, partial [Polyangiales bacterium]